MEVQCSIIPGIISDVSTQTEPIFGFVFGFNGGYFKKNAFLNIFRKIKKCSHFKTFHIKTKNKTKNWFCLGTNITNDARNDWTLHLCPQRASMFSNERKFSFLDLSYPKPNRNEKSLKIPNIYTKIHHLSIVPKKFKLLLTLLTMVDWHSQFYILGLKVKVCGWPTRF